MNKKGIEKILKCYNTVAVIGLSRDSDKDSYKVAHYLQKHGYHIIPINPTSDHILGQKAYKGLLDIPRETQMTIEIVDIFRPSKEVPPIVDDAIQLKKQHGKPYVVWMQLGITNKEAAEKAQKAGLTVVMNRCMMQEHGSMVGGKKDPELEKIKSKKIQEMMKKPEKSEKISTPLTVTDVNFEETIRRHNLIVIDCWAAWCGPCRMIAPTIEELAREHAGEVVFGKLNVDDNPKTAAQFNIMGIPTLLIMKDGAEVDRIVGVAPKPLIENKLKEHF